MNKNRTIKVMGIVNLTDDSYFSDSRCADVQAALERIGTMLEEGADIIDIGACSTRPGSLPVGADEEWRRLEPVLLAVKEYFPEVSISIDTYWASVVEKAHALIGKFIVNDISAGEDDPQMLTLSKIIFRPEDPGLVVMTKRGGINTALSFEDGRTHICTYDTPFMPFKVYVTSDKVDNRLLSVGKLNMDYTLNINDTPPQHFVISVTAKTNSEDPFKNLFDGAES
jgi:hypothetical protein